MARIGFVFERKEGKNQDSGEIVQYVKDEHGLDAEATTGYDGDGDGKFDDILVTFDEADEDAATSAIDEIKGFILGLDAAPVQSHTPKQPETVTVRKKYDKDGKEK